MSKTYSNNHYLKKSLGQNFLKTEEYVTPLISLINKGDLVIEVGAGKGFITDNLYKKTQNIILIEKDQRFDKNKSFDSNITRFNFQKEDFDAMLAKNKDVVATRNNGLSRA